MTASELAVNLGLTVKAGENGGEKEIKGCYICDLLSWVMGRCKADDAWITVMGNINAVAVAVLADAACIILCENAALDDDAKTRANQNSVLIASSPKTAYELALEISVLLGEQEMQIK